LGPGFIAPVANELRMLVTLTSEVHGSDDLSHDSVLRDQVGMPVDAAVSRSCARRRTTSAGRMRSPRQLAADRSAAVSSRPADISSVLIVVSKTMRHRNALAAVDDDVDGVDVDDAEGVEPRGLGAQSASATYSDASPSSADPAGDPARASAAGARIGLVHPHDDHHRSGLDDLAVDADAATLDIELAGGKRRTRPAQP
jgi:hypothetical protein